MRNRCKGLDLIDRVPDELALSYLLKHELELLLAMSPTSQRQYPEKMQQTGGKVSREQKSVFSVLVPIVPMGSSSGPFLRFPR